jgi:chemosensory pili system protein ChpA (sensor histidine kinase/response regulator)
MLNEIRPDCLALDIEMPRMNGFEFLVKFANTSYEKVIPIVMLTSRTSDKHREKAFQLGARAFLNKPCKDEEFVAPILRLTGKHDAAQHQWNEREKVPS